MRHRTLLLLLLLLLHQFLYHCLYNRRRPRRRRRRSSSSRVVVVVVVVAVVVVAVQYLFFPCAPPLASAGVGGQINGFVRPTLHYVHTCPTCGSCIRSTKKSGRIQSKHKQANGRMCPRTEWQLR